MSDKLKKIHDLREEIRTAEANLELMLRELEELVLDVTEEGA